MKISVLTVVFHPSLLPATQRLTGLVFRRDVITENLRRSGWCQFSCLSLFLIILIAILSPHDNNIFCISYHCHSNIRHSGSCLYPYEKLRLRHPQYLYLREHAPPKALPLLFSYGIASKKTEQLFLI